MKTALEPASDRQARPRPWTLYLMVGGTVLLWGASFPLTKAALAEAGPTAVAFLRWTVSALVLLAWLGLPGRRGKSESVADVVALIRVRWRTLWWVSLTGITLFYFLENIALRYTTATNASILTNLTPVFMVLIAAGLLRERLALPEWVAMLAAFAGSALVSQGAGHLTLGGTGLIGDALMIVASFLGAVYSIGGKGLSERYPATVVITAVSALGALLLLPLALFEGLNLALSMRTWAFIIVLGVGSGAIANLWWLSLLARTSASRAALILFLIPLVSATLSVTLLQEPITPLLVAGSALVLAGVVAVQRRS